MHLSTGDNATYLIAQTKSKFQNNTVIERCITGFLNYFKDYNTPYQNIFLNFDDLEKARVDLFKVFEENLDIKGV